MIYDATISFSVTLYFDAIRLKLFRFYVNKCENYDPAPLELVTNILSRKLSMFR